MLPLLVLDGGHMLLLDGLWAACAHTSAFVGKWHIVVIDDGVEGWQAAPIDTGGRQVCGVPSVCGGNRVSRGRTNGDHEYAYGPEAGLNASGVLFMSRGECYTCALCGIRLAYRNCHANFAEHTNMLMTGNGPSTHTHHRQARHPASIFPALF
jgi:hypothetical protein